MNNLTKIDRQEFVEIKLPEETMGICAQKKCNKYTSLGDGYCMECWDDGYGFNSNHSTRKVGQETLRRKAW